MEQFDEKAFKQKFESLDEEKKGTLKQDKICQLFNSFGQSVYSASVSKVLSRFFVESKRQQDYFPAELEDENWDWLSASYEYELNFEQVKQYWQMLADKPRFQLWKKITGIDMQLMDINASSRKKSYPVKDKGHNADINVIIGEEKPKYNSTISVKLEKRPKNIMQINEKYWAKVTIKTNSQQESEIFESVWHSAFNMILEILTSEQPEAQKFIDFLKITPSAHADRFEILVESNNEDVDIFLKMLTEYGDKALKTEILGWIKFKYEFNFNVEEFIENQTASIYDMVTRNSKICLQYRASQWITALKEMMLKAQAFNDLSYDVTDDSTLMSIFLVSMHDLKLNLKFKNAEYTGEGAEQQTLKQILAIISQLNSMILEISEANEDFTKLLSLIKGWVKVEAVIGNAHFNAEIDVKNLDKLLTGKSKVMKPEDYENNDD